MLRTSLFSAVAFVAFSGVASAVPLSFDSSTTRATGSSFLGAVTTKNEIGFTNVATDDGLTVDVRVTATSKSETIFASDERSNDAGYIADYNSSVNDPNSDLGFIYYGKNLNTTENGIALTFDFFDGTGDLSGTFNDILSVSELNFAIYDVDGESASSTQSEFFRAFASDGLVSYQLGNTDQALVATQEDADTYRFDGPGSNFGETDASGAAILNYENVSSLTIDFGSVMSAGSTKNPVFSAFDGDLSLIRVADFADPVSTVSPVSAAAAQVAPVPLPAGLPLLVAGVGSLVALRRRRNR